MEKSVILEEAENYELKEEEFIEYGIGLGLNLPYDEDLLYIAREGLKAPLPKQWKVCKNLKGDIDYFNFETGQSQSEHPLRSHYQQLAREAKSLKELKSIELKTGKKSLLNFQINAITNDLNSNLKEIENSLNALDTLRNKTANILSKPNNLELEMDFRTTCSAYQSNSSLNDPLLSQAYKDYFYAYQQKTSLYILWYSNKCTKLHIYNTETETEEVKAITPEVLDHTSCITQIPNGKLFCFGTGLPLSGITMLIDVNGGVEVLPSGTPCYYSSCIYLNNSVYCFGGKNINNLALSSRFDLYQNRWIQLTPMPITDCCCNSITFNGDILISGKENRNLLLYSIDINSFSTIPYEFTKDKRKILINTEGLYLIECCKGSIYESEIGNCMNWKRIADSIISNDPLQLYCSYNKRGIYIGINWDIYYKFDLNEKRVIKLQ